jgi:diadenosine tetraphosphate (Ap4A) HIT family hydrolase
VHESSAIPNKYDGLPRVVGGLEPQCRFCSRARTNEPWDEILAAAASFFAVPTKGALIAPWLLIVPRRHVLSTAELLDSEREEFSAFVGSVAAKLGKKVLYFEHGPVRPKTPIGCGVDHAHLHVLAFDGDFASSVKALAPALPWVRSAAPWTDDALRGHSYLSFSENGSTWNTCVEPPPVRQFFRQAVALALGCPERFDYEAYPQPENARETRLLWEQRQ